MRLFFLLFLLIKNLFVAFQQNLSFTPTYRDGLVSPKDAILFKSTVPIKNDIIRDLNTKISKMNEKLQFNHLKDHPNDTAHLLENWVQLIKAKKRIWPIVSLIVICFLHSVLNDATRRFQLNQFYNDKTMKDAKGPNYFFITVSSWEIIISYNQNSQKNGIKNSIEICDIDKIQSFFPQDEIYGELKEENCVRMYSMIDIDSLYNMICFDETNGKIEFVKLILELKKKCYPLIKVSKKKNLIKKNELFLFSPIMRANLWFKPYYDEIIVPNKIFTFFMDREKIFFIEARTGFFAKSIEPNNMLYEDISCPDSDNDEDCCKNINYEEKPAETDFQFCFSIKSCKTPQKWILCTHDVDIREKWVETMKRLIKYWQLRNNFYDRPKEMQKRREKSLLTALKMLKKRFNQVESEKPEAVPEEVTAEPEKQYFSVFEKIKDMKE